MASTNWQMYELLLAGFPVEVRTDFKLMSEPPRADIVLLRRQAGAWSVGELARLPDGVRHSQASNLILEFKYSESLTAEVLEKAFGYDIFYRETQQLTPEQVSTFILSAKTPRTGVLAAYGYGVGAWPGVYVSSLPLLNRVTVLLLNELQDEPHNAFTQCFASRQKVKQEAFTVLSHQDNKQLSQELLSFLAGLQNHWLKPGDKIMSEGLTPEKVLELGQEALKEALLKQLTPDEVLSRYKPEEVLSRYEPEEVLSHYEPEEVLSRYEPEEVLSRYGPEERLIGLEEYLTEREKKLLIEGLENSLKIRFSVTPEKWNDYEQRLLQLDFTKVKELSKTILLIEAEAGFEQALSEIEASTTI